jgi:hypothetical protein
MEEQMLTQTQVDFFREHGYLLVEGMFLAEEAAAFRADAHALIERLRRISEVDATWTSARAVTATKTFAAPLPQRAVSFGTVDPHDARRPLHQRRRPNHWLAQCTTAPQQAIYQATRKGLTLPYAPRSAFFPHDNDSMIAAVVSISTMRHWKKGVSVWSMVATKPAPIPTSPKGVALAL